MHILGTKRDSRDRRVPVLFTPTIPSPATAIGFAQALRKVTDVEPYDARRTYAHWLEEAG